MAEKNAQEINVVIIKIYINYPKIILLMKNIVIFAILIILLVNPATAKTIEENLYERGNVEVPGYNITLMVIGDKEDSVVVCVNNQIEIINKGNRKEMENLRIEPLRIYNNYAKMKITYPGSDVCNESCSNALCFGNNLLEKEEFPAENKTTGQQGQQQEKDGITAFSIILFLLVLILLMILMFKKKR